MKAFSTAQESAPFPALAQQCEYAPVHLEEFLACASLLGSVRHEALMGCELSLFRRCECAGALVRGWSCREAQQGRHQSGGIPRSGTKAGGVHHLSRAPRRRYGLWYGGCLRRSVWAANTRAPRIPWCVETTTLSCWAARWSDTISAIYFCARREKSPMCAASRGRGGGGKRQSVMMTMAPGSNQAKRSTKRQVKNRKSKRARSL